MGRRGRAHASWIPFALAPVAVAYGVAATGIAARHGDLTTYAGMSTGAAAAELAAGWALIAAGLVTWRTRPERRVGALAIVAGAAWFAPDWIGWQLGPGAIRMLALAAQGVTAAAVMQIAVATPSGVPADGRAHLLVGAIWTLTAVVGLGRVLFYDPFADPACAANCAANPLLLFGGDPSLARVLDWVDCGVALVAAAAAVAAAVRLAARPAVERRSLVPIVLPSAVLLSAWALRAAAVAVAAGDDPRRVVLVASFAGRAIALTALAAGLGWSSSRARRGASAVRRLAHTAGSDPAAVSLQAALLHATGDASLRVAFPLTGAGDWIDGDGQAFAMPRRGADRAVTMIAREGRPIAAVVHHPASLDASMLEQTVGPATQIAVDNERLRAEARAQLRELEASRARIVDAGDAERRRLERDLHDGAQQRLVGLSVALTMARDAFQSPDDPHRATALERADSDLHGAISELRELAHGIHPIELSDEGLAAALETLADRAPVPLRLTTLPDGRLPRGIETAGFVLVEEVLRLAAGRDDGATVTVAACHIGATLRVDVHDAGATSAGRTLGDLVEVADRVSALEGRLTADVASPSGVRIRAELPCA